MHVIIIFFFIAIGYSSCAQVTLLSTDEKGLYKHALDSAIKIVRESKHVQTLYIQGLECATDYLPDRIRDVNIITHQKAVRKKKDKLKPDELVLMVTCGQIIENKVAIIIGTPEPSELVFAFWYELAPMSKEIKLLLVNKGIKFADGDTTN